MDRHPGPVPFVSSSFRVLSPRQLGIQQFDKLLNVHRLYGPVCGHGQVPWVERKKHMAGAVLSVGNTVVLGERLKILNTPVFGALSHACMDRSEERRVGKECRS